METHEIARKAWEELKDGTHENFKGHKVTRRKNTLLLTKIEKPLTYEYTKVVVFPEPKHFDAFAKANKRTLIGGPGHTYPSSIGSLAMWQDPRDKKGNFVIKQIQAHFRTGNYTHNLPRTLANRYSAWRSRAIREAFEIAKQLGKGIDIPLHVLNREQTYNAGGSDSTQLKEEIETAAKILGGKVELKKEAKEFISVSFT